MSTNRCQSCAFLERYIDIDTGGLCKRYPPVPSNFVPKWPVVQNDDWCGEFKSTTPDRPDAPTLAVGDILQLRSDGFQRLWEIKDISPDNGIVSIETTDTIGIGSVQHALFSLRRLLHDIQCGDARIVK